MPDDLAARGAGIGTHAELLSVLAGLGIALEERLGAEVGDRVCLDPDGNTVHRVPWGHIMSGWANVYRPLKDRFPASRYHFGKGLARFERSSGQIIATFDDGSKANGDLLIGADGLRSAVRAQLYPGSSPRTPAMSPGARSSTSTLCLGSCGSASAISTGSACRRGR